MLPENPLRDKIQNQIRKERMSLEAQSKNPQDEIRNSYNQHLTEQATASRVAVLEQYLFHTPDLAFPDFFKVMIDESQKVKVTQDEKSKAIAGYTLSKGRILQEGSQIVADLKHLRRKISQEDRLDSAEVKVSLLTSLIQFLEFYLSNQEKNKRTSETVKDTVRSTIGSVLDQLLDIVKSDTEGVMRQIDHREKPFPISGFLVSRDKRVTELKHFLDGLYENASKLTTLIIGNLRNNPKVSLDFIDSSIAEVEKRALEASLVAIAVQREYVLGVLEKNKRVQHKTTESSSESPDPSLQSSPHDQEKS